MDRLDLGQRDFRRFPALQESGIFQKEVDVLTKSFKSGSGDHQIERLGGGAGSECQNPNRDAVELSG